LWLKALSRRTPSAYFIFGVVVLLLINIPLLKDYLQFFSSYADGSNLSSTNFFTTYKVFLIPGIIFLLSLLLNRVYVVADTFSQYTLWPGYLYVLFIIAILHQFSVTELAVHGLLGILITSELLSVHYNRDARFQCFNLGMFLGIAFLLETSILLLFPLMLYTLYNLKPLSIKEILLYLIGATTPIYFLLGYCFFISDFSIWTNLLTTFKDWFSFNIPFQSGPFMLWIFVFSALAISLFFSFFIYNSLPVYFRRLSSALFIVILGTIIIGIANLFQGFIIFYLAPAFAFFATMLMLRYLKMRIVPIIHFIFVIVLIGLQLINIYLL
jgi:hypothetical protein